jgi:hypothetical protein
VLCHEPNNFFNKKHALSTCYFIVNAKKLNYEIENKNKNIQFEIWQKKTLVNRG